jgi:hypothetical protein
MKKPSLTIFLVGSFFLALVVKKNPPAYQLAVDNISAQAIQAHMRFLSSDLLFGREPGTDGYAIAAKYMVSQFEKMGLEPAGDDSTYFQQVTLSRYTLDYSGSAVAVVNQDETKLLTMDDQYFIYSRYDLEEDSEDTKMIFAGYGLNYPDHNYLPLQNIEAEGAFLVALLGNPDFSSPVQTSGISTKIEMAESMGAKGIVLIGSPQTLSRFSWNRLRTMTSRGFEIKGRNAPQDFFAMVVHHQVAEDLTGFTVDSLLFMANSVDFNSFQLPTRLKYNISIERNETLTVSPNVVAKLPGSDPSLKNEYLVYTAHLDHIGVGFPVNGDSIYNGAYDNASGCAIMLEIANAYRNLPQGPSRSILFVALTAEEIGLWGSRYFTKYPTVPLNSIVANLNIDMVLMEGPLNKAVALGKEYVDFDDVIAASAKEIGIELIPDPMPQERLFMRSDHYSFVQQGIPALFIINDLTDSLNQEWFRRYYHSPKDEFKEDMHFDAGAQHARLNFLIGYQISENPKRPEWKSDSPFGRR